MYQSVGVIEDTISLLAAVRTFTHELGHAFGAEHDGIVGCDADKYVMAAGVQIEPGPIQEQWSDCSKNYIRDFLKDGAADCLLNAPVTYMNGSRCGDGFVTGDEECDSGHTPDACCTAECKLTTGSQCSSIQDCCTPQCQFKKAGAVCREGAHSCDLPDYCSGDTAVCTEDLVRQSGKPCETYLGVASKGGVCHRGTCRSADRQCNNLFNFLAVGFSTTHCESVQKEKGAWKEKRTQCVQKEKGAWKEKTKVSRRRKVRGKRRRKCPEGERCVEREDEPTLYYCVYCTTVCIVLLCALCINEGFLHCFLRFFRTMWFPLLQPARQG